jgi:hypothetical protein
MGLLVAQHLQPVLDRTEKPVGIRERRCRSRVDPACPCESGQGLGCRPRAQRLVASASNELLGLSEEFDLADATASKFHIVPGDPRVPDIL